MKIRSILSGIFFCVFLGCGADRGHSQTVEPQTAPAPTGASITPQYRVPSGEQRKIVLISDLHLGLGRNADGRWNPMEDFRWTAALKGFLAEISRWGDDAVDLVVVGDFLELWQPPDGMECPGVSLEIGCSVDFMARLASLVVRAHATDLALIRDFLMRGENRLHVIPGNHDSSLLVASVWQPLADALNAGSGRIDFVSSGTWSSRDARIVAEHGHQIGLDANRYSSWPSILREINGTAYLERPWGERFVQVLFNQAEKEYEIIDNLAPETVGAKYRLQDRGVWTSAGDIARFIAFNLFETSARQEIVFLGRPDGRPPEFDMKIARDLGYRLFSEALADQDPWRTEIEANDDLKREMTALAADAGRLPDSEVRALCEQIAGQGKRLCQLPTAGAKVQSLLIPRRHILAQHFAQILDRFPGMVVFVYGHTHQWEKGWRVDVTGGGQVMVFNTGAFQRITDENGFLARAKRKGLGADQALRVLQLSDLPPCYTAVRISYESGAPRGETIQWRMDETDSAGQIVEPGSVVCQ
jgi:hypothetical protein